MSQYHRRLLFSALFLVFDVVFTLVAMVADDISWAVVMAFSAGVTATAILVLRDRYATNA